MDAVIVRSLLLRLALVIAVVGGLLAMHSLVTETQHTVAAASVTTQHHAADAGGSLGESPDAVGCGSSDCLPLHAVGVLTCLLALLAVWALVGAAMPSGHRIGRVPPMVRILVAALRSVAPRPPSLVALSISRT